VLDSAKDLAGRGGAEPGSIQLFTHKLFSDNDLWSRHSVCSNMSGVPAREEVGMTLDGMKNSAPRVMDPLGRLLFRGQEIASYLFQVPDDASEWQRLRDITNIVASESAKSARQELPQIAEEMRRLLKQEPSLAVADQLVAGFDRMVKLWKSARSGLLDASRLSNVGIHGPTDPKMNRKRGKPMLWD
jgi:hypothetical protein